MNAQQQPTWTHDRGSEFHEWADRATVIVTSADARWGVARTYDAKCEECDRVLGTFDTLAQAKRCAVQHWGADHTAPTAPAQGVKATLMAASAGTVFVGSADGDTWTKNTDSRTGASRWTNQDGQWATSTQIAAHNPDGAAQPVEVPAPVVTATPARNACQWVGCENVAKTTRSLAGQTWRVCKTHAA
jgi:hypothetical protein